MGYYTFSKIFNLEDLSVETSNTLDILSEALEKAVLILREYLKQVTNNKIFSDILDADVEIKDHTVIVKLELDVEISPLSSIVKKEKEIIEDAVNVFFDQFQKSIRGNKY
mgnify:CR=1 FL=1